MKAPDGTVHRAQYRPPDFLVERIDLDFDLDPQCTILVATLELHRNASGRPEAPLRLDGEDLVLRQVQLDGVELREGQYRYDGRELLIPEVPDRAFVLSTTVELHPASNTSLMGLYADGDLFCTQCEPEAFRRITFFPDRPDVLARFTTRICADAQRFPVLLSNGNPQEETSVLDNGKHAITWKDPFPKPCYLFALVAGRLHREHRDLLAGAGRGTGRETRRKVSVNLYVEPARADACEHALNVLQRAMAWDEARHGLEYDLDVFNAVAVRQYTQSAMENKGLNIFSDRAVLADPDTATDDDYRAIEALVAHEYLHNWTGNRVTCRDWFQLGLKEGLTVFREQQFVIEEGRGELRRLEDVERLHDRQAAEDAGPMVHAVRPESYREIDNFYSETVYNKGAEIVRMLSRWLGNDAFERGLDLFLRRHDGHAVTVEEFLHCMEEVSGEQLWGFTAWYDRPGSPQVQVRTFHDPAGGVVEVEVEQHYGQDDETVFPFPLAVGFLDHRGGALTPASVEGIGEEENGTLVLPVNRQRQRFRFSGFPSMPVVSLLRGYSAHVSLHCHRDIEERLLLARHDPDPCARRQAITGLALDAMAELAEDRAGNAVEALVESHGALLEDRELSAGMRALMLDIPQAQRAAGWQGPDLEALCIARDRLRAELGECLRGPLLEAEEECRRQAWGGEAAVDAAGLRALARACLELLVHAGDGEGRERLWERYRSAENMTDRLHTLELLVHCEHPQAAEALDGFRKRWQGHAASLDRWFALQARAPQPGAVPRIRALMDDPLFSASEPARARSLLETFCLENPAHFHARDGSGYRFIAEQVRKLDRTNSQLAGVLGRELPMGARFGPERARHLEEILGELKDTEGISRGLEEIVSLSLQWLQQRRGTSI